MWNAGYATAGLVLGAANTVRHRAKGYTNPRPFDKGDLETTIIHAQEIVDRLETQGEIDWTSKRVLEIGPGNDLSSGALMLHRGAASYMAIDAFDNRHDTHPKLYQGLEEHIGMPIEHSSLGFTLTTFPDLPELHSQYDLIVSNATLEHISNISDLFAALRRFAGPKCRMIHNIDGRTHMRWIRDRDPLNILRYPDFIYDHILSFPGAPNRLRASDYEDAAKETGWSSMTTIPIRVPDPAYLTAVRPHLYRRFRSRSDLGMLTFTLVAE